MVAMSEEEIYIRDILDAMDDYRLILEDEQFSYNIEYELRQGVEWMPSHAEEYPDIPAE
jgi:hypothetical protein